LSCVRQDCSAWCCSQRIGQARGPKTRQSSSACNQWSITLKMQCRYTGHLQEDRLPHAPFLITLLYEQPLCSNRNRIGATVLVAKMCIYDTEIRTVCHGTRTRTTHMPDRRCCWSRCVASPRSKPGQVTRTDTC
jgi:hypothetical protein